MSANIASFIIIIGFELPTHSKLLINKGKEHGTSDIVHVHAMSGVTATTT